MKTHLLVSLLVALAALLGANIQQADAADTPKPNVLFIMSDDMRTDLGCYGHKLVQSPNIDALAAAGVRFDRAYCQYPLCNPSRTSLLTGRFPIVNGVVNNSTWFGAIHPDFISLPKYFKANGYVTLRSGKIFHGGIDDTDAWTEGGEKRRFEGASFTPPPRPNRAQQSDRRVVLEGDGESHGDYRNTDRAIELLRANKGKPFFLAFGLSKPHSPPTAPKKFYDLYDLAKIPLPPDFAATPTVPEGFPRPSVTQNGDLFIKRAASELEARQVIQSYWASITFVDWNVGRIMAELKRLGLQDRTIVLFWGDHGYHLGEKGKWSKHGSLFEVGTRVPFIIVAPGAKGNGKASPRTVQALDFYPTLVDLCGLPQPKGLQGHSLKPLLDNPEAKWEHPAFSLFGSNPDKPIGVAVRTERYRYVDYGTAGAMLFDEQNDPHELKNLADDPKYAQVREELAALTKKHRALRK